jgi:hypothetical protein
VTLFSLLFIECLQNLLPPKYSFFLFLVELPVLLQYKPGTILSVPCLVIPVWSPSSSPCLGPIARFDPIHTLPITKLITRASASFSLRLAPVFSSLLILRVAFLLCNYYNYHFNHDSAATFYLHRISSVIDCARRISSRLVITYIDSTLGYA